MPDHTDKRQILKGIYEENLWVRGKRQDRVSRSPARKLASSQHKSRSAAIIGLVVIAGVGIIAWAVYTGQNSNNSQNIVANSAKDILPNAATNNEAASRDVQPGSKGRQSQLAGQDANAAVPESLQKHISEVEKSLSSSTSNKDLASEQYQALADAGIPLSQLFGLGVRTIIIDPGHGGKDPGAIGKLGTYEAHVALEIAKVLRDKLKQYEQFDVLMTREADETMSLSDRVEFANVNNADLFISIHINTYPKDEYSFVETYYFGAAQDNEVAELAALENAESHFQYADFKEMIQKIGDTLKFQESRQLAHAVQTNLFQEVRKLNKHTKDHGIKSAPFVVLLGLDAPSILSEVACFCNPDEEKKLKSVKYREKIAAFLEQGIVKYLNRRTNVSTNVGGKRNGEKEELAKAQ